MEFKEIMYGLQ